MFYLIQKNKILFTQFLLTIDNVKSFYIFLCIIAIVLVYKNGQLRIRWKISKKYTYSGKGFLQKNLFCLKASYK